jgi:hypothetical protein
MLIGKPQREIHVEPLKLPQPLCSQPEVTLAIVFGRRSREEILFDDQFLRLMHISNGPTSGNACERSIKGEVITPEKAMALAKAPVRNIAAQDADAGPVITAYRAWQAGFVNHDQLRLVALGSRMIWEPRQKVEAECRPLGTPTHGRHRSPEFNCWCGVWGFSNLEKLLSALVTYRVSAIGKVSLWGRVIETEDGYRAQYAYPQELWLPDRTLENIGLIYGVPVRTIRPCQELTSPHVRPASPSLPLLETMERESLRSALAA